MSDQRTYPAGVPCWIDTEQPDATAARTFYAELFGWTFQQVGDTYWIASLSGQDVAGLGIADGGDATWNSYLAVDDADAAAASVGANGGRVAGGPVDVGPAGRTATIVDPTGAPVRLWQAGERPGAQVVNTPNSWNFSDLHTDDLEAAKAFYAAVFGWEADALDLGGGAAATMWRRPGYGDHLMATIDPGMRARQAEIGAPPGFEDAIAWLAQRSAAESSHWHVAFTVADRDESVSVAERLGAVVVSSEDTEWTRATTIRDPQGAELTLSQFLG